MSWAFPATVQAGWRWFRSLNENPIYLREKGSWGNPNPFYETLRRYSPFVVMGAIVLGLCAGTNPALLGATEEDELFAFICVLCLPGALLSMLTIYGSFMAPALTAPTISLEVDRGTWDILRLTPHSTATILLAKLFGGLARLRIWRVMLALSGFQALMMVCVLSVTAGTAIIPSLFIGLGALIRPWVEVLFAAFIGMYISTWVRSSQLALAGSYVVVVLMKIFSNSAIWLGIWTLLGVDDGGMLTGSILSPAIVYGTAVLLLWWGIVRQAGKLSS
ncbi:MAG: ABC transporter permease subunit [Ardenticatenaceae bacterium]|nr:ABC transporter permease subunit [Anaerolineales bacterium]MCB8938396.1 ABC transporter permease subunit [Ardenticatenaceae bacterium]MCB8975294.1 ABC transporter permease subunit [Ardenticatenaceae bacterium]